MKIIRALSAATLLAAVPANAADLPALTVTIQPAKSTFTPDEPLVFNVTFHNNSKAALRLPTREGNPVPGGVRGAVITNSNYWILKLTRTGDDKAYTGVSLLPMGAALPGKPPSDPIPAGGMLTFTLSLSSWGFPLGEMDYEDAKNAGMRQRTGAFSISNTNPLPLGPGSYRATMNVRFPSQPEPDSDPTPVWKGDGVLSNQVEIAIAPATETKAPPPTSSSQPPSPRAGQ